MKAEELSKWVHDKVLEKWGDGGGTYARPLNYLKPVLVSVKWAEYIFGVVTAYVSSNTGGGDGLSVWWPEISCVTQSVTAWPSDKPRSMRSKAGWRPGDWSLITQVHLIISKFDRGMFLIRKISPELSSVHVSFPWLLKSFKGLKKENPWVGTGDSVQAVET